MADFKINDLAEIVPGADTSLILQTAAGVTGRIEWASVGGSLTHTYGSLYYYSAVGTALTGTATSWNQFAGFSQGPLSRVTADVADAVGDHLTIVEAGTYLVHFATSIQSATANSSTFRIGPLVNDSPLACGCSAVRYLSGTNDTGSIAGVTIGTFAVNDEISLGYYNLGGANRAITVLTANLAILRVS